MIQKYAQADNHLKQISRLLSMYQAILFTQLECLFPELTQNTLRSIVKKLERLHRAVYAPETDMVLLNPEVSPSAGSLAAIWVLIDFDDITYHTISDFPIILTFFTASEGYDIIYVNKESELLMNHALSFSPEEMNKRLVIVNDPLQIKLIDFPGITAFCMVLADGKVQYYKKQGVDEH